MRFLNPVKRMRCEDQMHKSGHGKKRGKGGVHGSEHKFCNASRTTNFKRRGGRYMALLKAPSKQPKTTNLQVRLEEEVRRNLDRYAEFLDATPSYVVSEAPKLPCCKDKEFQNWLSKHPQETKEANQGAVSIP
jgi:hypothetical protein